MGGSGRLGTSSSGPHSGGGASGSGPGSGGGASDSDPRSGEAMVRQSTVTCRVEWTRTETGSFSMLPQVFCL
jgi:hypothetical protein